ncbi:MAG: hypothetical protein ACOYMZ_01500 [Minisyncoccia bacterium]
MKIAIFSSWLPEVSEENKNLIKDIVRYLCDRNITVVTGGCSGIPAIAIETAHECGAKTIGYFPLKDQQDYFDRQHEKNIHCIDYYSTAHFIAGFTARSLEMVKNVDAAIVLNGRIGTLSEFGIAIEEGLPLAVIENSGGISDELKNITKIANKEFPNNEVIFDTDYKKATDMLIEGYNKHGKAMCQD